jgi:hypothetical protein
VCVGRRRGGVFRYYEDVESEGQGFANEEDYACYVECQVCLLPRRSSPSLTPSIFTSSLLNSLINPLNLLTWQSDRRPQHRPRHPRRQETHRAALADDGGQDAAG